MKNYSTRIEDSILSQIDDVEKAATELVKYWDDVQIKEEFSL